MSEPVPSFGIGRLPRISFGAGRFSEVPQIVAGHGERVLLVTGSRSFAESPRRMQMERGLQEAGVSLVGIVSITGEPGPDDVEGPGEE